MEPIAGLKAIAKRHWPALSLRAILFGTLLFVAALPGVAALFLRVYENTIVQQTEAELIAQTAVLASAYKVAWREGAPAPRERPLAPERPTIDLRAMPILTPFLNGAPTPADPHAQRAARTLVPVASDAAAVTLAAIRLLDARGTVVLGRDDVGLNYAALPEVRAAMNGRSATVLRGLGDYGGAPWIAMVSRAYAIRVHHCRPIIVDGRVVGMVMASRTPRGLFTGIYQDRWSILTGIGLILVALVVLAGLLSRGIARPIDALSRASEDIALGRVAVPDTPITAAIEIRALYDNFRSMAERIERRSRYLRDFAAAVSHEFKTPIAGIRGALELIDDHGATMSAAERQRFIANATADTDRLQRLVERLLDLARADMITIDAGASADIAAVIARLGAGAVRIVPTLPESLPRARITPEVLETILETLLDNSRHAGATSVAISAARDGDMIALSVADDGCGVPEADRERIFEPFFTARRDSGGTGIGLAIVRSLLGAMGGSIVCFGATRGACFAIRLPVA